MPPTPSDADYQRYREDEDEKRKAAMRSALQRDEGGTGGIIIQLPANISGKQHIVTVTAMGGSKGRLKFKAHDHLETLADVRMAHEDASFAPGAVSFAPEGRPLSQQPPSPPAR